MIKMEFTRGVLRHFPKDSGEKLEGKEVFLGGNYCHPDTGVG